MVKRFANFIKSHLSLGRIFKWLLVVGLLWLVIVLTLGAVVHRYAQVDQKQPADVIIVLGAGLRRNNTPGPALYRRTEYAANLWREDYAPEVICTGGYPGYATRSEADACLELLQEQGVPSDVIILEDQSRSTEENAFYAHEIMRENNWDTAVLVSDGYHLFRANWIFQLEGMLVYPSPAPGADGRLTSYLLAVGREVAALHWQALKETLNLPITYVGGL